MTKHGFLDKIKTTASTIDTSSRKLKDKRMNGDDEKDKESARWNALKDDYMMKPKKVCLFCHDAFVLAGVANEYFLFRIGRTGMKNLQMTKAVILTSSKISPKFQRRLHRETRGAKLESWNSECRPLNRSTPSTSTRIELAAERLRSCTIFL
jgi:hypothetical protein